MKRYKRPSLQNHAILYKGRRFWVFAVDQNHPFEGYENYGTMVLYDCLHDAIITEGAIGSDGVIRGSVQYGQGGIDVEGKSVQEFVASTVGAMDWIQKEVDAAVREDMRPVYNGRRIQLLRGKTVNPSKYNLRIFDKKYDLEVGAAQAQEGGAWIGIILNGMIEMPVSGRNLQEFIKDIASSVNKAMNEGM